MVKVQKLKKTKWTFVAGGTNDKSNSIFVEAKKIDLVSSGVNKKIKNRKRKESERFCTYF